MLPGRDHSVFHPLSGADEAIDVNIIAQYLEPILRERERDGTNLFDMFGTTFRRKEAQPTELVVFCVDCSYSMEKLSDFAELNDDDMLPASEEASLTDVDLILEDEDDTNVTLVEIRTWIQSHESYEDFLCLTKWGRLDTAKDVVKFLSTLTARRLSHFAQKQREISQWSTNAHSRKYRTQLKLNELRRTLTGLNIHENSLAQFLVFAAESPDFQPNDFEWKFGDSLPTGAVRETSTIVDLGDFCTIPQDYLCSISQHIIEDPVRTTDGFIFDRKAIERWYRIRKSSPLTGLPVQDTTLRSDEVLATSIKSWVRAEDVIESLPSMPKRTRLSMNRQTKTIVEFVAPSVRFTREVPTTATLLDLYKVAYRGVRGMYSRFSLYLGGDHLACTEVNMGTRGVVGYQTVAVVTNPDHHENTEDAVETDARMSLVRIYDTSNPSFELYRFWAPQHSELTVSSILFHHWRYSIKKYGSDVKPDWTVWTELYDGGDNFSVGTPKDSWNNLAELLFNRPRVPIKEREPLYESIKDSVKRTRASVANNAAGNNNNAFDDANQYGRHRVLKIGICDYEDPKITARKKLAAQKILSRMAVTKQVFSAFINRLIAYNFPTNIGLVTFGTEAKVRQNVTDVIENFRQALDSMDTKGETALWDALALAADHLVDVAKRYPKIKKRIICLSDGHDTNSTMNVEDVVRMLMQHEIVV